MKTSTGRVSSTGTGRRPLLRAYLYVCLSPLPLPDLEGTPSVLHFSVLHRTDQRALTRQTRRDTSGETVEDHLPTRTRNVV